MCIQAGMRQSPKWLSARRPFSPFLQIMAMVSGKSYDSAYFQALRYKDWHSTQWLPWSHSSKSNPYLRGRVAVHQRKEMIACRIAIAGTRSLDTQIWISAAANVREGSDDTHNNNNNDILLWKISGIFFSVLHDRAIWRSLMRPLCKGRRGISLSRGFGLCIWNTLVWVRRFCEQYDSLLSAHPTDSVNV